MLHNTHCQIGQYTIKSGMVQLLTNQIHSCIPFPEIKCKLLNWRGGGGSGWEGRGGTRALVLFFIQSTYSQHTVNIQSTCSQHTVNIQSTSLESNVFH